MSDPALSLSDDDSEPSLQIQQNVGGDSNQVIGQVRGGNVFGNALSGGGIGGPIAAMVLGGNA